MLYNMHTSVREPVEKFAETSIAVSYTHLDVYKRQSLESMLKRHSWGGGACERMNKWKDMRRHQWKVNNMLEARIQKGRQEDLTKIGTVW